MITSQAAKAMYDKSGVEVQKLFSKLEPEIKNAAESGKRTYTLHLGALETCNRIHMEDHPVEQKAIEELRNLGYCVTVGFYGATYVPHAYASASDDSDEPWYQNYGITIGW
jgi:hypothetical protein